MPEVDLTTCDREPIHIPEHIQPHGVMVAWDAAHERIDFASENVTSALGQPPDRILGMHPREILPAQLWTSLQTADTKPPDYGNPPPIYRGDCGGSRPQVVAIHRHAERIIAELEPASSDHAATEGAQLLGQVNRLLAELQAATTLEALCSTVTASIKRLFGYDRVMMYRFAPDWHGWVSAESAQPDLEPFLGLHYPASDIPKQARALFLVNRIRQIPDVGYARVPVLGSKAAAQSPLDMTHASLRGVSPIHIEYLQNMKVSATFTMSIQHEGQLWGMVACHHYSGPKTLSHHERTAAELTAQAIDLRVASLLAGAEVVARTESATRYESIAAQLVLHDDLQKGLDASVGELAHLVDAGGMVIWQGRITHESGTRPSEELIEKVVQWLQTEPNIRPRAVESLEAHVPDAAQERATCSGLLAVPLTVSSGGYVLWFRPERVTSVTWAGSPHKPAQLGPHGARLTPRKSFEAWVEEVRGVAEPWSRTDLHAGEQLRLGLERIVLRDRERVLRLNAELASRNEELDAFAAIAAHDLREPLRGISNYTDFLEEDLAEGLDPSSRAHIAAIRRLTKRMYALIQGLHEYARFGRMDIEETEFDIHELLESVIDNLQVMVDAKQAEIQVVSDVPSVRTWEVGMTQVLQNLIANALRYVPEGRRPHIQVGCQYPDPRRTDRQKPPASVIVFVRDNGIGIAPKHVDSIFKMFGRLHPDGKFGPGVGIGLSTAKRLVERMGGEIWVEPNDPEVGSTFYFSLQSRAHPGGEQ